MVKGKTRPHPFSWFVWALLGGIVLFFYHALGARETLPLAVLNFFGPTVIFILSVRRWEGSFPRFDYICLALSLVSVVFYLVYHDAGISLTIALVADLFAFLPTFRKSYLDPASENVYTWSLFFIGDSLSLFAVATWTYGIAVFPVYMTVMNGGNFFTVLLGRRLKKAR